VFVEQNVSESEVSGFPLLREALEATADDRFSTPLIDAVKGIADISVDSALELYPGSVNDRDTSVKTALHWAAEGGNIDAVRLLLSFGADPSVPDLDGYSPLHFAATFPNLSILQVLLEAGSNPHAETLDGLHPLHLAVDRVLRDHVLVLIQAGANANAVDRTGRSVFYIKRNISNTEEEVLSVFQLLVENGADPNMAARFGHRPLHQAIYKNNTSVFRALCHLGVEFDYLNEFGCTILHWIGGFGRKN
jgi:ankyrin repeat protein